MADSKSEFLRLRNVDSSFQNRSSSIFDGLDILEPSKHNSRGSTADKTATKEKKNWNKRRNNSPRRGSRRLPAPVPQHVLSPEKWTKYSLEDDGSGEFRGLNEHSLNKHAAHSFLADLKKRKSIENAKQICPESVSHTTNSSSKNQDLATESKDVEKTVKVKQNEPILTTESEGCTASNIQDDSKFLFKKPKPKKDVTSSSSSAGVWKDGSYIMPEYVVGSARSKGSPRVSKRPGAKPVAGNGPVNLGHLQDERGDDVEEGKIGTKKGKRNFRKRKLDQEQKDDGEET